MRRSTFLLALGLAPQVLALTPQQARTRVEITAFHRVSPDEYTVAMRVTGATTQSQPVLLIRTTERFGLHVASDRSNAPVQPRTDTRLPPGRDTGSLPQKSPDSLPASIWAATFHSSHDWGAVIEVYAVVCEVRERPDWTKDRDYRGLGYLPFNKSQSVEDALLILRDFGWTPTGFTRIAP
jgi:hypothetical protein